MKVIITGCGGLLGRELLRQLAQDDRHTVCALSSNVEKTSMLVGTYPNTTVFHADALINGQITCDSNTILINCAFPRNENDPQMAQGLEYVRATLCAAAHSGIGAIINISSQSVYDINRTSPATEKDSPLLQSKYAVGKYATELFTKMLQPVVPCTNIRLASLISKDFDQRLTNKMAEIALETGEISVLTCDQRFGFLDVEDAARGILMLLHTPTKTWDSVYNLGSNYSYSLMEIAQPLSRLLAEEWNISVTIKEVPSDKTGVTALCNDQLHKQIGNYQYIPLEESLRRIIAKKMNARNE